MLDRRACHSPPLHLRPGGLVREDARMGLVLPVDMANGRPRSRFPCLPSPSARLRQFSVDQADVQQDGWKAVQPRHPPQNVHDFPRGHNDQVKEEAPSCTSHDTDGP